MYTQARVEACDRDDLDGSREIRYPVRVCLDGGESGVMEVDGAGNGDFEDSARLAKFYSLTSTILDNIASTAGKVAYPVGISAEQASVVDHFLTPAFILGRGGTGKTTCLVYKLVGRYLFSRENVGPLRQVGGYWVSEIESCCGGVTLATLTAIGLTHEVKEISVEVKR
ncbi:hypothetical protein B9Z19DRAFT_204989 [Tuber borchii]|uniref:Uncharacterized protein n=1 Tax=Tuber borchii TaxID=42251 RepID=A0A2T6ZN86_TUBBO|nr:hypothetical protein B9Z19DRAFT_204989 [Tuber borchii]